MTYPYVSVEWKGKIIEGLLMAIGEDTIRIQISAEYNPDMAELELSFDDVTSITPGIPLKDYAEANKTHVVYTEQSYLGKPMVDKVYKPRSDVEKYKDAFQDAMD